MKPTSSFHKWFSNSKVVEADGTPKVVYHSTYNSFDEFSKTGDLGFHFGSAFVANKRIEAATKGRGRGDVKFDSVNVMPAYLSIENPLHLAQDPISWAPAFILKLFGTAIPENEKVEILRLEELALVVARAEADRIKKSGVGVIRKSQPWSGGSTFLTLPNMTWSRVLKESRVGVYPEIRAAVKRAGFDGLTYVNEVEGEGRGRSGRIKNQTENLTWVAFDPTQVKSAIGNNGEFDAENTDIRFSMADQDDEIEIGSETPCP